MHAAVLGVGAVGARVVRQLLSSPEVEAVTVADRDPARAAAVRRSVGEPARVLAGDFGGSWADAADVVVLALDAGWHADLARDLVATGTSVVSTSSSLRDVEGLLALGPMAEELAVNVVVGAGMAPGMSCLLAAHAASRFDQVDEIHVARMGAGGPACAREHHRALHSDSPAWRDGEWTESRGGTGRELSWFPDPVGALDCYRAALPDPLLLHRAFPDVARLSARLAATRRDRFTATLPMLRRPHPEGRIGAIRVEVRGSRDGASEVTVYGAIDRPAVAAGTVGALSAVWLAQGRAFGPGAAGLAGSFAPAPFLVELARRGVKGAVFEGTPVS